MTERSTNRPAVWLCISTLIAMAVVADLSTGAAIRHSAATLQARRERSRFVFLGVTGRNVSFHQVKRLRALLTESGVAAWLPAKHVPALQDSGPVSLAAELPAAICSNDLPPSRAPPTA